MGLSVLRPRGSAKPSSGHISSPGSEEIRRRTRNARIHVLMARLEIALEEAGYRPHQIEAISEVLYPIMMRGETLTYDGIVKGLHAKSFSKEDAAHFASVFLDQD